MSPTIILLVLGVIFYEPGWGRCASPVPASTNLEASIPYVPTRHDTVKDLLWLAETRTNDVVYDLGSGDGRVVIAAVRDFGARKSVGIEIKEDLVQESRQNAINAGMASRVEFIHGDLFTNDVSQADVVALYLGANANLQLRERLLRTLKPGARVVSHQFAMGEWLPDKRLDVRTPYFGMYGEMNNPFATNSDVPDFSTPFLRLSHDVLSEWIIPSHVAGNWRGKISADSFKGDLILTLHQRLSGLTGSFQVIGATNLNGMVQADLWGTHLRLHCSLNQGAAQMWFEGQVTNDVIDGKWWLSQNTGTSSLDWIGHRDKNDFVGKWEWPGPKGSPVQLSIERRDGRIVATYFDKNRDIPLYSHENQPMPVIDFYDFGGGFYFTLLLGQEDGGRRMGPDDGWVIGEAVAINNSLSGTIAFYPYPPSDFPFRTAAQTNMPPLKPTPIILDVGKRDWQPKRLDPD